MPNNPEILRILLIDDEIEWSKSMSLMLRNLGYTTEYATSFEEARTKINEAENVGKPFDIATIDSYFDFKSENEQFSHPKVILGNQILQYIKKHCPYMACIMITGNPISPETALDLRDDYELDYYISKDRIYDGTLVTRAIQRAVSRTRNANHRPRVFISYRRSVSWGHARAIANSLRERKIDVFLDYDNINQGRFDTIIDREIREREFFVPILTPQTLESEWVVKEINKALVLNKQIVPLLIDGFSFDSVTIPPIISDIQAQNGFAVTADYYENAMDRLVTRFLSK